MLYFARSWFSMDGIQTSKVEGAGTCCILPDLGSAYNSWTVLRRPKEEGAGTLLYFARSCPSNICPICLFHLAM